jgi:periplasmic protein TonB
VPLLLPGFATSSAFSSESWFQRIRENLRVVLDWGTFHASAETASPLRFISIDATARGGSSQTFSAIAHAVIFCALFFLLARTPHGAAGFHPIPIPFNHGPLSFVPPLPPESGDNPSLGRKGGSGDQDSRPARRGNLAPSSSMPLAPPRLVHNEIVEMPVPPAVFDRDAPASVPVVSFLGLPWSTENNDSAGRGRGHGIGDGDERGMGDGDGDGAGAGEDGSAYANVAWQAACQYCPEPSYTEEARKAKLQGTVLVQVLVGTDGLAKRIRVKNGLGMGVDERAIETVRGWHFMPARDASRKPLAVWVTIEMHFMLY